MQQLRHQKAQRNQHGVAAKANAGQRKDLAIGKKPLTCQYRGENLHGVCKLDDERGQLFICICIHNTGLCTDKAGQDTEKQDDHFLAEGSKIHGMLL